MTFYFGIHRYPKLSPEKCHPSTIFRNEKLVSIDNLFEGGADTALLRRVACFRVKHSKYKQFYAPVFFLVF